MNPSLLTLGHRQARRFQAPARVRAESGVLWVTVDGEREDILLGAGECRAFHSARPIVVYALGGDARFEVSALAPRTPARRGRLGARWFAWLHALRAAPRTLA